MYVASIFPLPRWEGAEGVLFILFASFAEIARMLPMSLQNLDPQWLTVIFAGLTFLILCLYTYFTWKIAKITEETLSQNMRPIVSCELKSGKNYYPVQQIQTNPDLVYDTRCIVTNHSKYNLRVFVNLNLKIDGKLEACGGNAYTGKEGWPVTSFQVINGHFNLTGKFNLQSVRSIIIDLDVSYQGDTGKIYKNPTQHWHFDIQEQVWVNDIGVRS